MVKVPVYNQQGEQTGELALNSRIFDVEPKVALLEEAVRAHLANRRAPVAHTKTRAEVRGGGRKPWKQKGTGRARHGSIRSPLWSGGGVTFGPSNNRNWSLKMNKSAKREALFMSLTDKLRNKTLILMDKIEVDEPKTSVLSGVLNNLAQKLKFKDERNLTIVVAGKNATLERAGKNLKNTGIAKADSLNVYDILKSDNVVIFKDALPVIEKTYLKSEA